MPRGEHLRAKPIAKAAPKAAQQQQPTPQPTPEPSVLSSLAPAPAPSTPQRTNTSNLHTLQIGITLTYESGHTRTFLALACKCGGCQEVRKIQWFQISAPGDAATTQSPAHTHKESKDDDDIDTGQSTEGAGKGTQTNTHRQAMKWKCEHERLHLNEVQCDGRQCKLRSVWGLPKLPM